MAKPFATASEALKLVVDAGRAESLKDAWLDFLHYLRKRHGQDLESTDALVKIGNAMIHINRGVLDRFDSPHFLGVDDPFLDFQKRTDVLAAVEQYFRDKGWQGLTVNRAGRNFAFRRMI